MSRARLAALALTLLFLTGCATHPTGIVDVFVPPQAEPVASQLPDPAFCHDAVRTSTDDPLRPEEIIQCAPQIVATITSMGQGVAHPRGRRGIVPPTMGRR